MPFALESSWLQGSTTQHIRNIINHLMQSIGVLLISFLSSAMCLAEHPASLVEQREKNPKLDESTENLRAPFDTKTLLPN